MTPILQDFFGQACGLSGIDFLIHFPGLCHCCDYTFVVAAMFSYLLACFALSLFIYGCKKKPKIIIKQVFIILMSLTGFCQLLIWEFGVDN